MTDEITEDYIRDMVKDYDTDDLAIATVSSHNFRDFLIYSGNGSWQRKSTTESTERYCFLCALCGYKPFQEIIKSLHFLINEYIYTYSSDDHSVSGYAYE